MKISKKMIALGLCFTTFTSMLTSCGTTDNMALVEGSSQKEITFSWWGSDSRHEYTIAAIKEFEKQNPDIKVNLEYSEFTGFQLKTDVQIAAHTEADIMQLNYSWVSNYSPDGSGFYDLEQLSDELDLSNYDDDVLDYGRINGTLNALPIAQNGQVFVYNETLYQKYNLDLPTTWDDFFEAAEVMNDDGVYPLDIGSVAMWLLSVAYAEQTSGHVIISEDGDFTFTEQDVRTMISFYCSLVEKGVVKEISKRSDDDLLDETAAATVQWINSAEKYGEYFESIGDTSVIGTTPLLSGSSRSGWYVRPATMYAISANTQYPEESAKLLNFLVSSEEMTLGQQLDKGIPFNKKAKEILDENNMLEGLMNDAATTIDNTETYLMNPKFEDSVLSDALYNACVDVLYGDTSLNSAAHTAYKEMKENFTE
ncbi:MAG: ABC transporter substrate-binding protein [Clostridiaceae bacterium]|nr:ABC transporter substrate-binding protein [Clostridiaceae bacterium]